MSNEHIANWLDEVEVLYAGDVKIIGEEVQRALLVESHRLLEVLEFLKTNEAYQFNMLRNLTAVDYLEYMEIVYHLYSLPLRHMLTIKTHTGIEHSVVPSVTHIWPSANFQEREVYDLLGIKFAGHPDLRRILLPHEFEGHPLRKTYSTDNSGKRGNQ